MKNEKEEIQLLGAPLTRSGGDYSKCIMGRRLGPIVCSARVCNAASNLDVKGIGLPTAVGVGDASPPFASQSLRSHGRPLATLVDGME
jgi:hypothetical protein